MGVGGGGRAGVRAILPALDPVRLSGIEVKATAIETLVG